MKSLVTFILFCSTCHAQSGIDPDVIASYNMSKVTNVIDTTVKYKMYDLHENIINAEAKVKLFFANKNLVAAQRIFEDNYQFKDYFFYFHNNQLIVIQYKKTGSDDLYKCAPPRCIFSKWDLSLANAITDSFSQPTQN